jgi:hypothetical protein
LSTIAICELHLKARTLLAIVVRRGLQVSLGIAVALATPCITHAQPSDKTSAGKLSEHAHTMSSAEMDRSVFWVGHSLIEQKASSEWGEVDLMSMVGLFARDRGLGYRTEGHVLWGSPVSALWRGRPHGYARDASSMVPRREAFERDAKHYDTMVLTEGLPVEKALRHEYSAYYIRMFYCTLKRANPSARVYLYQTWVNLQAGDAGGGYPPIERFDWVAEMASQRTTWERLADSASRPGVRQPTSFDRIGWVSSTDAGCSTDDPILLVPVGNVLVRIGQRIAKPEPADDFRLASGDTMTLADLFSNPYVNWPRDWPLRQSAESADLQTVRTGLKLRDPSKPHDDIHSSQLGIYVAALTHFATLYRQSPRGLRHPAWIGDGAARTLQCITWEVVSRDPRAGVGATSAC